MSDFIFLDKLLKTVNLNCLDIKDDFDSELEITLNSQIDIDNSLFFGSMGINSEAIRNFLSHFENTLTKLMIIEQPSNFINLLQNEHSITLMAPYKKAISSTISFKHFVSKEHLEKYSFVITIDFKRYGKCRISFLIDENDDEFTVLNTIDSASQKYMKLDLISKFIDAKLLDIFSAIHKINPKTYLLTQRSMQELTPDDIKGILAIHEMATI